MKKLLFLILFVPSFVGAQNSDLIDKEHQELPDISEKVPASVNKLISPNEYFKNGLKFFTSSTIRYSYPNVTFPATFMPFWQSTWEPRNEMQPVKEAFFKDKDFWEPLYQTTMPLYQERLKNMPVAAAEKIIGKLEESLEYAKNFDLAKEKAYLDGLGKRAYEFVSERGKMNAFIYRRIANQEMSKQEVVKWMERIVKDFKAVMPETKAKVDNYIIFKGLFSAKDNDYYWGYEYQPKYDRESLKHMLFKKEGEKYRPLASISDEFELKYTCKNACAVTLNKEDGTKGLYHFSKDETTGETTVQVFGADKAIKSIAAFSDFDAMKLIGADGAMDIVYNLQKKQADVYTIKSVVSQMVEFKAIQRYFVLSEKGEGQILRITTEKEELKIILEETLPEGITEVQKIKYISEKGSPGAGKNHGFKLESKGKSSLWTLNEKTQKWVKIPLKISDFEEIEQLENGAYRFTKAGKFGLLTAKGEVLLESKYLYLKPIKNNFLVIADTEMPKAAFFDAKGKALTAFKYEVPWVVVFDPNTFEEGMGPKLEINEKAGMVSIYQQQDRWSEVPTYRLVVCNHKGEEIIASKYEYISEAYTDKEGIAYYIVSKQIQKGSPELEEAPLGKYGVLNSLGEKVIPLKYAQINFISSVAYFNPETFEESKDVEPHFIGESKKGKVLFLNLKGEKIENPVEKKD